VETGSPEQRMQEEVDLKLKAVLTSHSLNVSPYKNWWVVEGGSPAFRASVHRVQEIRDFISLQLDVEVFAAEHKAVIVESFGGFGTSAGEAVDRAFVNFVFNSLHVFLNALCGRTDDHVVVEQWTSDRCEWTAWVGGITVQAPEGQNQVVPESLSRTIQDVIRQAKLEPRIHWARFFYGNSGTGNAECEFLLDNETLESAESALRDLSWVNRDFYYSVRNFLIMLPT
jgi:hypothetical protein